MRVQEGRMQAPETPPALGLAQRSKSLTQMHKSPGRGQTYLKPVGQKVMWKKQRTSTLLPPPQSEEAELIRSAN